MNSDIDFSSGDSMEEKCHRCGKTLVELDRSGPLECGECKSRRLIKEHVSYLSNFIERT